MKPTPSNSRAGSAPKGSASRPIDLGTTKITGQVAGILAQLPEVVKTLTGADLAKFLKDKISPEDKPAAKAKD